MESKPWFKSRTIWFNLVLGILAIFQGATGTKVVDDETMTAIGTAGNLLLRTVTGKPIG